MFLLLQGASAAAEDYGVLQDETLPTWSCRNTLTAVVFFIALVIAITTLAGYVHRNIMYQSNMSTPGLESIATWRKNKGGLASIVSWKKVKKQEGPVRRKRVRFILDSNLVVKHEVAAEYECREGLSILRNIRT